MKKKFIMLSLVVLGIAAGVGIAEQAKAVPEGLALKVCTLQDDTGKVVSIGNTCVDGSSSCISNPCASS